MAARRIRFKAISRDTLLFLSGLILTYNEAFRVQEERPFLLAVFAGMMGLPVVLRADQWPRLTGGTPTPEPPVQGSEAATAKESG